MEPIVLKLSVPIPFGQDTITEVKFREPVFKDYRASRLEERSTSSLLDFAVKLSNQPPAVMDSLSNKDTKKVLEWMARFLADGEEEKEDEKESGESA